MASTAVYRALMAALEGRRLELGLSMATVNDISGLQDGFFAKMLYPDTPSGRQARWETVQLAVEALFGSGFVISIIPDEDENKRLRAAPRIDDSASANARNIRHWRHTKHFQVLGTLGAKARNSNMTPAQRSQSAKRAAKARWRKIRDARRQGAAHKRANEEARAR